jgi:hypothetical protein
VVEETAIRQETPSGVQPVTFARLSCRTPDLLSFSLEYWPVKWDGEICSPGNYICKYIYCCDLKAPAFILLMYFFRDSSDGLGYNNFCL